MKTNFSFVQEHELEADHSDQDELRQLLESLKSSDVMSVKHKKGTKPTVVQQTYSKPYIDSDLDLSEGEESPGRRYSYGAKQKRFNQNLTSYLPSFGRRKNVNNNKTDSSLQRSKQFDSDVNLHKSEKIGNGSLPNGHKKESYNSNNSVSRLSNGNGGAYYNHGLSPSPPHPPPIQVTSLGRIPHNHMGFSTLPSINMLDMLQL